MKRYASKIGQLVQRVGNLRGCRMLVEFLTKPEFPFGGAGSEPPVERSDGHSPAAPAAKQGDEPLLIMEALVREYLTARQPKK